jgi:aminoglycoside phosphotransferase family enzyme/predicted kinase
VTFARIDDSDPASVMRRLAQALPEPVELRETHGAWVLLSGERALKLRKPVHLGFLDYSSVEQRRRAAVQEVAVNQPLAAKVYLGVRAIVDGGQGPCLGPFGDVPDAIDYAVEMRRFDEQHTMAALCAAGRSSAEEIDGAAERIAVFHADARPCAGAGATRFADRVQADLDDLEGLAELGRSLRDFAGAALRRRSRELDRRAERDLVRDGHGDLRAEHVVFDDELLIVDRLEFDADLRCADVASDLAFLLMDLEDQGARWAAERLAASYRQAGGDPGDRRLRALFSWQRTVVRAKVALIRDDKPAAQRLLGLVDRLAWRERAPAVLLIAGPPASGKSTLAGELGLRTGLPVVGTDRVRKELLGAGETERLSADAYTEDVTRQVYREVGRRAARAGEKHDGVIIDATARTRDLRAELFAGLAGAGPVVAVTCQLSESTQVGRARARLTDPARVSDADPAVAAALTAEFQPIRAREAGVALAITANTDQAPDATVDDVAAALDRSVPSQ